MGITAAAMIFVFPLTCCAAADIFFSEIPDRYQILLFAGGIGLGCLLPVKTALISIAAGSLFLAVSLAAEKVWKKSIGGGDIKLITTAVVCTGLFAGVSIITAAFVLAGVFSIFFRIFVSVKKRFGAEGKSRRLLDAYGGGIPFAPFLLAAVCMYYSFAI